MMSSTFAPDHNLVGRYRIVELIGVGHTAEVYLAEDLSLHRSVAVKVLLSKWAAYEDVRRAFRDNIIRAATLGHPHVARVFDGGQESGSIFVVTEYLSGGSLEELLASGRHLSVEDTARLGRDVAGGLAYLHANGIVHGSLSPKKLLFDAEGHVRISDVALAGLAQSYRGQPTLDQMRYLSPEQAIGEPASAASDVYTLALILFEAATGTSPFDSMTPDAMMRSRNTSPLPVRPELGTLDMLLAQAALPDPLLRLDAQQFSSRLGGAVDDAAPLVVRAAGAGAPLLATFTPPQPRTSIGFRPPSPDQIVGAAPAPAGPLAGREPRSAQHARPPATSPRAPRSRRALDFAEPPLAPTGRRRTGFLVAAVIVLVAALGGALVWKMGLLSQNHAIPSLYKVDYRTAPKLLSNDGFTLRVTGHVRSASVPLNGVISQTPSAGTSAKSGQVISVVVSDGPTMVKLPTNLVGEDCVSATSQLLALHVTGSCPSNKSVASSTVATGHIVRVLYEKTVNPTSVPIRSLVTLVLSSGPGPGSTPSSTTTTTTPGTTTTSTTVAGHGLRPVPNVIGMNQAQVVAAFQKAQLFYNTAGPLAHTNKWTKVVSSIPAPGTMVKWRSTITLNVQ